MNFCNEQLNESQHHVKTNYIAALGKLNVAI